LLPVLATVFMPTLSILVRSIKDEDWMYVEVQYFKYKYLKIERDAFPVLFMVLWYVWAAHKLYKFRLVVTMLCMVASFGLNVFWLFHSRQVEEVWGYALFVGVTALITWWDMW